MKKLKLMTIVGTRPEIIKLSETIKKCDKYFDHVLVHTGQNYDYKLNKVFFEELGIEKSGLDKLVTACYKLLNLIILIF